MIRPVEGSKEEYLACCRSEFLGATFSCLFKDTLMGALALHAFSEMIRKLYEEDGVRIVVSDKGTDFRSKALLDLMFPGKGKRRPESGLNVPLSPRGGSSPLASLPGVERASL